MWLAVVKWSAEGKVTPGWTPLRAVFLPTAHPDPGSRGRESFRRGRPVPKGSHREK